MTSEKYEPIKFDSWQELAKFVIDGGDVYYEGEKIIFDDDYSQFNYQFTEHLMNHLFIKKQPTLEELIAIKPRLCWVWDNGHDKHVEAINSVSERHLYDNAQMLTDDEIKQFLNDGE